MSQNRVLQAPGTEKFKAFNAHFSYDEIEIIEAGNLEPQASSL